MAIQVSELKTVGDDLINIIESREYYGKTIFLLGSAEFGATNEPVLCGSSLRVYAKFGHTGTLIDAFHKIKNTYPDNDIYLVKTTGTPAVNYLNVNIEGDAVMHQGFIIESKESNEMYNETKISITPQSLTIENGDKKFIYEYTDYPYMEKLADGINNQPGGFVKAHYAVESMTPTAPAFYPCNPSYVYLSGGTCGLNYTKDMLYNCLERTYGILESVECDFIIPVDAFMDDTYPDDIRSDEIYYGSKYYQASKDYLSKDTFGNCLSFLNQLIAFCIRQTRFGVITHGIVGFNRALSYNDVYNESNELTQMYIACMDYNYSLLDDKAFAFMVSVVAGDIRYNHESIDNSYLAYAALCTKCMITEGTTNRPISDRISLYHEFEQEYLEKLDFAGIVAFRQSIVHATPVVYNGTTAFRPMYNGSLSRDWKNFANVRMVQLIISDLNYIYQRYVGESIYDVEKVIYKDTDRVIRVLTNKGIISKASYKLNIDYRNMKIKVYLELETLYMIKPLQINPSFNLMYTKGAAS